jgi:DNA-binding NarL/FixJ family response regulator
LLTTPDQVVQKLDHNVLHQIPEFLAACYRVYPMGEFSLVYYLYPPGTQFFNRRIRVMSTMTSATQIQKVPTVSPAKNLRILVADDHDILRRGLKQLLTSHPGWEVCGEAKTGREAVSLSEQNKPDIVVIDISMPDLNGLEAARRIRKALPKTGIIILTLHFSDQLVKDIVEAGARGYVMKADADRDLVNAVEALSNRRTFFTARAADMLLNDFSDRIATPQPAASPRSRLTSREREIVQLLAEGKSSKEVAVALGISVKTAETHRANVMRKLQVHSVSELVRYAIKNSIIEA